jgi:hypothetical protein
MHAWMVACSLIVASLPAALAFASGKEVVPIACRVVLADRRAVSWVGAGEGRTAQMASENALHNTCDGLAANERTLCRQQAPMGKWAATMRKSGDPAHQGRASYHHYVSVEIFKPRSRIRAVGRTAAFLTTGPIEESEDYGLACRRAVQQACRLLGAGAAPGFDGPAGAGSSRPCVGVDWRLVERALGRPADAEGASFEPDPTSRAPGNKVPLLPERERPSAARARRLNVLGGN